MLHARSAVEGGRRAHKRCPDHCRAQWSRIGGMPLRHIHAVAMAFMQVAADAPQAVQTLLSFVPLQLDHVDRLRPLLDRTLGLSYAERSVRRQRSADGQSSRNRYRTACLGRIVGFSQIWPTYACGGPSLPCGRARGRVRVCVCVCVCACVRVCVCAS